MIPCKARTYHRALIQAQDQHMFMVTVMPPIEKAGDATRPSNL